MATGVSKRQWHDADELAHPIEELSVTLAYPGKRSVPTVLATPPADITVLQATASSENRLLYGDNLPLLASLAADPSVRGKVKLVYIDPPYATNYVYQSRNQINAYADVLTGASYVEFLRQRLVLLHELLSDDGSIYVHLDNNMMFHIKIVMDEIFGVDNFRSCITRRKCSHKNATRRSFGNISDYILFYSKGSQPVWNRALEPWDAERAMKEYPAIEPDSGRRYKKVPIHAPGTRNGETGKPWRGMEPPPGKHWQYPPATLDEMDARGEIYWSPTGNPRRKIYLDESAGIPLQDIWYDVRDTMNQNVHTTGYPTEKNPHILERIILASSNSGDLVLDCFAGSGTTLDVASQLGRRWIGIDNSPEALKAMLRRLQGQTERMGNFVAKGAGQAQQVQPTNLAFHFALEKDREPLAIPSKSGPPSFSIAAVVEYADEARGILERLNPR